MKEGNGFLHAWHNGRLKVSSRAQQFKSQQNIQLTTFMAPKVSSTLSQFQITKSGFCLSRSYFFFFFTIRYSCSFHPPPFTHQQLQFQFSAVLKQKRSSKELTHRTDPLILSASSCKQEKLCLQAQI